MPIFDLTGYTWVGNSSLNKPDTDISCSLNFVSNNNNYTYIQAPRSNLLWGDVGLQYDNTTVYNGVSGWENDAYKTIQITGGTDATNSNLISWLEANGTLTAPQPTGSNYLTFSSPSSFTLNVIDNIKYWDGTLEYSTDTQHWDVWDGTTTISAQSDGTKYNLYMRGVGNTFIIGSSVTITTAYWVLTGSNISCDGNIENLLDYQTVALGNHPTMADYCYYAMFYGCTSLISAPELPATTLADRCYYYMFYGCTSLTTPPELPATTLASRCYDQMFYGCTSLLEAPELPATTLTDHCYYRMFYGCTKIKLSETQTGNYTKEFRIPTSGTGTTATSALSGMFTDTGGTFAGTPTINTTYYLWEEPTPTGINNVSVGTLKLAKALVGSDEISQMWLGDVKIYEKGGSTPSGYSITVSGVFEASGSSSISSRIKIDGTTCSVDYYGTPTNIPHTFNNIVVQPNLEGAIDISTTGFEYSDRVMNGVIKIISGTGGIYDYRLTLVQTFSANDILEYTYVQDTLYLVPTSDLVIQLGYYED